MCRGGTEEVEQAGRRDPCEEPGSKGRRVGAIRESKRKRRGSTRETRERPLSRSEEKEVPLARVCVCVCN